MRRLALWACLALSLTVSSEEFRAQDSGSVETDTQVTCVLPYANGEFARFEIMPELPRIDREGYFDPAFLWDPMPKSVTAEGETYKLSGLPEGRYTIRPVLRGFYMQAQKVTIQRGLPAKLLFTDKPLGQLTVRFRGDLAAIAAAEPSIVDRSGKTPITGLRLGSDGAALSVEVSREPEAKLEIAWKLRPPVSGQNIPPYMRIELKEVKFDGKGLATVEVTPIPIGRVTLADVKGFGLLANALITVLRDGEKVDVALPDPRDRSTFDLPVGTYRVEARVTGRIPWAADFAVAQGETRAFSVELPLEKPLALRGLVVNAEGAPVRNARVHFILPPWDAKSDAVAATGEDGRFVLDDPFRRGTPFNLAIVAPGYVDGRLASASTADVTFGLAASAYVYGSIKGVNGKTAQVVLKPEAGTDGYLYGNSTEVQLTEVGKVQFGLAVPLLKPGSRARWTLSCTWMERTAEVVLEPFQPGEHREVNLEFTGPVGAIVGEVKLPEGNPAAFARLICQRRFHFEFACDDTGKFKLPDVPTGDWDLRVRSGGFGDIWLVGASSRVVVAEGKTASVNFDFTQYRALVINLPEGAVGLPAVQIESEDRKLREDVEFGANRRMRVLGLRPGKYTLRSRWVQSPVTFTLDGAADTVVTAPYPVAQTIRGKCLVPDGYVGPVRIKFTGSFPHQEILCDASGHFSISTSTAVKSVFLLAQGKGIASEFTQVAVPQAPDRVVELTLKPAARFSVDLQFPKELQHAIHFLPSIQVVATESVSGLSVGELVELDTTSRLDFSQSLPVGQYKLEISLGQLPRGRMDTPQPLRRFWVKTQTLKVADSKDFVAVVQVQLFAIALVPKDPSSRSYDNSAFRLKTTERVEFSSYQQVAAVSAVGPAQKAAFLLLPDVEYEYTCNYRDFNSKDGKLKLKPGEIRELDLQLEPRGR